MSGADEGKILDILKDKNHQYGGKIKAEGLAALAAFVSKGLIDMTPYIDGASKKAKGNAARGDRLYHSLCSRCHGEEGKKLDFGNKKQSIFVGTISNDNPWEILHKIRFGQPSEDMMAAVALSVSDQVDILTYIQTLPTQ